MRVAHVPPCLNSSPLLLHMRGEGFFCALSSCGIALSLVAQRLPKLALERPGFFGLMAFAKRVFIFTLRTYLKNEMKKRGGVAGRKTKEVL